MERLALTSHLVDELDEIEREPDLIHIDSGLVLMLLSRLAKIKEDAAAHDIGKCPHLLVELSRADVETVGDLVLVESRRRELSNQWVHPVLDGQHSLLIAAEKEPLEEAPRIVGLERVVSVGRGRQLILVADEDDFLGIEVEGDEAGWLRRLAGLVNDQVVYHALVHL